MRGRVVEAPEIDRVAWFEPAAARISIKPAQAVFIARLVAHQVQDGRP
jgi:predicted NUDIX family NTP pyrophosphohydrolase